MALSGQQITQQWPSGRIGAPYGEFAALGLSGDQVTRMWPYGGPGHQYGNFAGKSTFQQVEVATTRHAGRRRRRRYYVEIDGETFWAEDEGHAQAILDRAAELATQAATKQADEIVAKRLAKGHRPVAPVKISAPVVETSAPIDLRPYEEAIRAAYRRAAELAELQLLLAKKLAEEDEEEAILLLM